MKRLVLSLITWCVFVAACNEREGAKPTHDFERLVANFNSMYKAGLRYQLDNMKEFTSMVNGKIVVDHEGLTRKSAEQLNSHYFSSSFDPFAVFNRPYKTKGETNRTEYYGDLELSAQARYMLDEYVNQMGYVTDSYTARYMVSNFQNQTIYSSDLSYNDQVLLLSVSEAGAVVSDYFFSGYAARDVGAVLQGYIPEQYETLGCSVNWRNVWISSSVGFFGGATYGAYVGATGGTVVLPVVGTVTGIVGGAVFGGAGGFVSGFVSGVAGELLGSCFRPY